MKINVLSIFEWPFYTVFTVLTSLILDAHIYDDVMQQKGRRRASEILLTCIKQPFVMKINVLSIFGWPFYSFYCANIFDFGCSYL